MEGFFGHLEEKRDFGGIFWHFGRIFKHFGYFEVYFGLKGVNHNIFGILQLKCLNFLCFADFRIGKHQQFTISQYLPYIHLVL